MRRNIIPALRQDDPTTKHIQMWGNELVKENCLSLAALLKYLSAREKVNLFKFIKAKQWQQGRGGVNQWNVKQRRGKYFPLLSVERIYQYVHLGHAAVIYTHQHHFKSALWNSHFVQSFPFNKDPFQCASSLFRQLEKEPERTYFSSMSEERQAPDLCCCICYITYFSNWIHLFIFN